MPPLESPEALAESIVVVPGVADGGVRGAGAERAGELCRPPTSSVEAVGVRGCGCFHERLLRERRQLPAGFGVPRGACQGSGGGAAPQALHDEREAQLSCPHAEAEQVHEEGIVGGVLPWCERST